MIIRRKQTSNYTALPNVVLTDERISIDARWCLAYLLSKPHDWQVQTANIQKVGGIGKDKARKLITELINAGWIVRSAVRSDDGTFGGYEYVVSDSPSENSSPETEAPKPENPALDNPKPGNKSLSKYSKEQKTENIQKTDEHILAQAEFDEFWAAYPKRTPHANPKHPASLKYLNARQKLKVPREVLLTAAKAYAASVAGKDPEMIAQAVTWLNQRRWEDYDGSAPEPQPKATISDEAYRALEEHYPGRASDADEAKRLMAAEVNKGAKPEDIADAAHKFKLLVKQARNDGHDMAVPILETWLKFRWRDMDAYEFYRGGMTMKLFVRPKRGK